MKPRKQTAARFWAYINDGWVKLSLARGQVITWGQRSQHEEGWSSEYHAWSEDGHCLREVIMTDGTDCDGRLSTSVVCECPLDKLQSVPILDWEHFRLEWHDQPPPIPGMFSPAWEKVKTSQRDYAAEAAGY